MGMESTMGVHHMHKVQSTKRIKENRQFVRAGRRQEGENFAAKNFDAFINLPERFYPPLLF